MTNNLPPCCVCGNPTHAPGALRCLECTGPLDPKDFNQVMVWPDGSYVLQDDYCDEADRWRGDDYYTISIPLKYEEGSPEFEYCVNSVL